MMESRWYIPPFRGKDKGKESEEKRPSKNLEVIKNDLKQRIKQLQIVLNETDEEHKQSLEFVIRENLKISNELQDVRQKMETRTRYDALAEKIEAQKVETQEIKNDIHRIRAELENLTQVEESLYFELQEKKEKGKVMKEENLRSAKESQVSIAHYRTLAKDLQEKLEALMTVNKLEKSKNLVLRDFMGKVNKKREKDEFSSAFYSEFRVLKFQLQSIDKEIAESVINMLNHSNSIISNTFDYTDTTY